MKQIDYIFFVIQSTLVGTWIITAKDLVSWVLATALSLVTILYIYEKYQVQKLEKKKLQKELKDK